MYLRIAEATRVDFADTEFHHFGWFAIILASSSATWPVKSLARLCSSVAVYYSVLRRDAVHTQHVCLVRI